MLSRTVRFATMCRLALLAQARPTPAGVILNPDDFTSLGAFAGGYTYAVDTSALTMTSYAVTYTGVTSPDGSAVFTFDDITFDAGRFMMVTGPRPFAFLSRGSAIIAGEINGTDGHPDKHGVDIQIGAVNAVAISGQVRSNGGAGTLGNAGSPGNGGGDGSGGSSGDPGDSGQAASGQSRGSAGRERPAQTRLAGGAAMVRSKTASPLPARTAATVVTAAVAVVACRRRWRRRQRRLGRESR